MDVNELIRSGRIKVKGQFCFPNSTDKNYNTVLIVFEDLQNNHPYLIYVEKVEQNTTINVVEDFNEIYKQTTCELTNQIMVNDKKIFEIIDLKPPVSLTKQQIEDKLGYKINIVS